MTERDSDIEFEVWLPLTNWNGKFNGVGNGGLAGTISYTAMAPALERGYATANIGKWHLGPAPESMPIHFGFDVYFGLPEETAPSFIEGDQPTAAVMLHAAETSGQRRCHRRQPVDLHVACPQDHTAARPHQRQA